MPSDPTPTGTEDGEKTAEALAAERFDLTPGPDGQDTPTATGEKPEPEKAGEVNWEQVLHRASSAFNNEKALPALPVAWDQVPERLQSALLGFGYKPAAEGEKPKETAPTAIPVSDITALADDLWEGERDVYEAERETALEEATTAEERETARTGTRQESARRLLALGTLALEEAGFDLPEDSTGLYKALDRIFGHPVPRGDLGQRAAARFAAEARLIAQRKKSGGVDLEAVRAKVRAETLVEAERYLAAVAERQNGQERIERGDLVTAAGSAVGSAGSVLEELQSIDMMTPEGQKKFREREQEFRRRTGAK